MYERRKETGLYTKHLVLWMTYGSMPQVPMEYSVFYFWNMFNLMSNLCRHRLFYCRDLLYDIKDFLTFLMIQSYNRCANTKTFSVKKPQGIHPVVFTVEVVKRLKEYGLR